MLSLLKEPEPPFATAFDLLSKLPDIFLANNDQKKEIDVSMDREGNSKPIWNQLWPRKWYNLAVMRLSQNYFQTEM